MRLSGSDAPSQSTTTVLSFDQSSSTWLIASVGLPGAARSIRNGPRWTAQLQLPALSVVRRWNHHSPSASGSLVAVPATSSTSFVVPGSLVASCVQEYEKPSTPLPESDAPVQPTSTEASFDHVPGAWLLDNVGFVGAAVSIRNGPRCVAPLQFPALSFVRRWNHHSPSARGVLVAEPMFSSTSLIVSGVS